MYFNSSALRENIENDSPLSFLQSSEFNNDLDFMQMDKAAGNRVLKLGSISQNRLDTFKELSFKYKGFIGWRIVVKPSPTSPTYDRRTQNVPYVLFEQHLKPSYEGGLIEIDGPWCEPYIADEDRIATALGMATYQDMASRGANTLISNSLGSHILANRRFHNI